MHVWDNLALEITILYLINIPIQEAHLSILHTPINEPRIGTIILSSH